MTWRQCGRCGKTILGHRLAGLRTYCELTGSVTGDFDPVEIEEAYLAVGRKVPKELIDAVVRERKART